jgi:hypothetical protein
VPKPHPRLPRLRLGLQLLAGGLLLLLLLLRQGRRQGRRWRLMLLLLLLLLLLLALSLPLPHPAEEKIPGRRRQRGGMSVTARKHVMPGVM